MAITASGQPESGRIRFAGSVFPHTIRIRIGCFFLARKVARIIIIGSVFVHLARFRYRCVIPDPLGLNEARSDPLPTNKSRPRPAFLFRAGWSSIDPNQIRFCTSGQFQYRCVMPDPLGLNEARSDPPAAKQIGTTSRICIPGRMVTDQSETDPFLYIWPGSYIDALSFEI